MKKRSGHLAGDFSLLSEILLFYDSQALLLVVEKRQVYGHHVIYSMADIVADYQIKLAAVVIGQCPLFAKDLSSHP